MPSTPFSLGYGMPAEWEKHEATWLAWPKDPDTFPKGVIENVESIYVQMIEALSKGEKVNLLVDNEKVEGRIKSMLKTSANVIFHDIKTADAWMRDYGPIFIKSKNGIAVTKWIFNSWGNKYYDLLKDNQSGMEVAKLSGFEIFEPNIVLEGGSIDTNGLGTCITTEQCLLNRNRNPSLKKEHIENYLRDYLGFKNFIWLKEGIEGDDTDGHVDDIARFVNENTIICMMEEDSGDENCKILKENFEILKNARDQAGNKLSVIPIPMPRKIKIPERRLAVSYANFYIGNSVVLLPTFNDKNDQNAISTLSKVFPDREIVTINCEALVYGYGGMHCVTQQQPAI